MLATVRPTSAPASGRPVGRSWGVTVLPAVAVALSAVLPLAAIAVPGLSRWLVAMVLGAALVVLAIRSSYAALLVALVYVVVQGLLRRVVPEGGSALDPLGDPLLLVLPVVAVLITIVHARRSRLDLLGWVVLAIQVGLALSVLNPLGATVSAGLAQLVVVALPLTWFWVTSRSVHIDAVRLRRLLCLVVLLGVAVTAYGRLQVAAGFPPWDRAWIEEQGVASLRLGEFVRPFSTFTAASDYATFLGLGLAAAGALLLSSGRRSWLLRLVLVLVCALFVRELVLLGSRGILLASVLPVVIGLLVRCRLRLRYAVAVGLAGLALLPAALDRAGVATPEEVTSTDQAAVARQIEGLSDPFGEGSTLPGHLDRLVDGVRTGWEVPLGLGVGVIGLTSGYGAGGQALGTETAYGDLGVALGLAGTALGLLYAGALLWKVGRQPPRRRDEAYWMLLFLAVVPLGPPLMAGNYAAQLTVYALLGAAWRMLDEPVEQGASA